MADSELRQLTLLEEARVQAKVLVPVLRAFRAELGEERANEIAREALYAWWLAIARSGGVQPDAHPRKRLNAAFAAGGYAPEPAALDIDPIRSDLEVQQFNVTGCRYANFFREIGEPDLGFMLLCNADNAFTEAAGPGLELVRTQTIMQGANHCDFKWQVKGEPAGD